MIQIGLVIYVDVDDTFIRSYGTKRMPIPSVIEHVRVLKDGGAQLYCWSSGGAEYARQSADECGITDCFIAFLAKPNILIDDQKVADWRGLEEVHPSQCAARTMDDYLSG